MPNEILDGIYEIRTLDQTWGYRVYFFNRDGEVPTLIDTGHEHTADAVFEGVEEIGVEPERLFITHEDGDHSGAIDPLVERYGVETWAPADDADAIEETSDSTIDYRYEDGDAVGPFTAVHVPGHTPGLSVLIDEDASIAVTGDALIGADMRGFPEGYLLPPPEIYTDDPAQAERSLENLLPYEFDVALVYHGSIVHQNASDKVEAFVEYPDKPDR